MYLPFLQLLLPQHHVQPFLFSARRQRIIRNPAVQTVKQTRTRQNIFQLFFRHVTVKTFTVIAFRIPIFPRSIQNAIPFQRTMELCKNLFQFCFRNVKQGRAGPNTVKLICKINVGKRHAQRFAACEFLRALTHPLRSIQHRDSIPFFHKTQTVTPAAAACIQCLRPQGDKPKTDYTLATYPPLPSVPHILLHGHHNNFASFRFSNLKQFFCVTV